MPIRWGDLITYERRQILQIGMYTQGPIPFEMGDLPSYHGIPVAYPFFTDVGRWLWDCN